MNREKSVIRKRLGQDTLDRSMRINIDGSYLDNFDTEKLVSDCIEFAVTRTHLYGHNSFRTETHEKAQENVIDLYRQDYYNCIYFFFLLG